VFEQLNRLVVNTADRDFRGRAAIIALALGAMARCRVVDVSSDVELRWNARRAA
jgi:hypothetical protein